MSKGGKTTSKSTVDVPAWWTGGIQDAVQIGEDAFKPYISSPAGVRDGLTTAQQSSLGFLQDNLAKNPATSAIRQAQSDIGTVQSRVGDLSGNLQNINDTYLQNFANQGSYTLATLAKNYPDHYSEMQPVSVQSVSAPTVAANQGVGFMDAYKNPYVKDVVDASTADLQNAYKRNLVGSNMAAAAAGAFGGGRHGIRDAQVSDDYLRTLANTSATLRSQGFDTAANLGMQDANRYLAADTTNASNNLAAQQFNVGQDFAAQQFNNTMQNQRQMFDVDAAYRGDQQRSEAVDTMQNNLVTQAGLAGQQAGLSQDAANLGIQENQMGLANAGAVMDAGAMQFNQPVQAYQSLLAPYGLSTSTFGQTTTGKKTPGLLDWVNAVGSFEKPW